MVGARSRGGWLPLVATVQWRSERRGSQWPVAVTCGGERSELVIEETWIEGPAAAGGPLVRGFVARDGRGRRLRIRVDEARAKVLVELESA